jgi:hypothetical protein
VSDAFFFGEENYLRAWAYCYSLSIHAEKYESGDVEWVADDTDSMPSDVDNDDDERYDRPSKQQRVLRSSTASSVIPSVPFASVSFGKSLGYGRNGCVFRADWQGQSVAVKQFDLGRPGVFARFRKEISAYEMLKLAQGVLVPKALFLTQRMGIAYLGLELERDPAEGRC